MAKNLLRAVLKWLVGALFRVRVQGDEGAFLGKRILIIANHESFIDGLVLGLFLPVNPVFVVHTGIANNRWFKLLLSQVDYLAVDPTNPMAMKKVIKLIESGKPVMIFPEGRITVTGSLMKVYDGPAFVAAKTGATIVPVRLDGPARSFFSRLSGRYPRSLFPRVTLSIQPPKHLPMPEATMARERRHKAGELMRRIMQEMLFASQPKQTLYSALLDAISIHGKKRRLLEDLKQIEHSYGEILRMTLALGRLLEKETLYREHVGVLMPNLAATVALILGLSARGRVPAMLNYTAGADGLQNACTAAGIRTVVTSKAFLAQAKLEGVVEKLQNIRLIYVEDLKSGLGVAEKLWILFHQLFPRRAELPVSPNQPALVLFTSGSEGKPKGVVLSHLNILANIAQIRAVIDFSVDDKLLVALPMFHSFGLTAGTLLPILTGARLFLYPTPLHYRIIPELAYDRNCTVFFGTSTFLANYARFAHSYDFYRLRYVIAGAEKLADSVRQTWFERFGLRILEGYGATETSPVLAVNTPMAYRTGTVGQLLPGIKHQLMTVPGIETGGILHVQGPNVMLGYYRFERPGVLEPASSEAGEGWYSTGDVVTVDDDGFLRVVGRVKRFAKVAGEMVSLEVVEKIATMASKAGSHAATTMTDEKRGETIVLVTTDTALDREKLQSAARALGAPEIALPRRILKVDALPLLGTGKTDYVTLKALAQLDEGN